MDPFLRGRGYAATTFRLSLTRLFVVATVALALVGGATFFGFLTYSERSILAQSAERREVAALRVEARTTAELEVSSTVVEDAAREARLGALAVDDPEAIESRLFSEMLDHPTLSDVTLTRASQDGFAWQVSVFRVSEDPASAIWTRRIRREGAALMEEVRRRTPGQRLLGAPFAREPAVPPDPTKHATYEVTVAPVNYGHVIWSDLSYSEIDKARPLGERRVVVTAQETLEDRPGHLVGVLRAGILTRTIDAVPRLGAEDVDPGGPERVFLCDGRGRLVSRLHPGDVLASTDGDLRVVSPNLPPEIATALEHPGQSGAIEAAGQRWLVTFRTIPHSQDWRVGIVVPASYYTQDLRSLRNRFLVALLVITVIAVVAGIAALRPVRRSLTRIVDATARMRRFELAPSPTTAPLREVVEVMEGVERAKTSMRALGKYVPVDLVRELHAANREPQLGGTLVDLSLMFTDIEGFTSLSERLTPDALALALGAYLEAMTAGVRSTDGTVDKFIGDAVMAFWNAPLPLPDHALRACRAALACMKEARALYASPAWKGLPPLFTRYGLHTARVMVGHFGAPERLSYTALGDGVNLAARLEPLCKHYGVAALASEAIVSAVGPPSASGVSFRLVDKVAVKGKKEAVCVFELLEGERTDTVRSYEEAFTAYLARDFLHAHDILITLPDDPPSQILAARCADMLVDPPPADWDGVYVAKTK